MYLGMLRSTCKLSFSPMMSIDLPKILSKTMLILSVDN